MALTKGELKDAIVQIMTDMMTKQETSIEEFAERLSDAVDDYVKKAEIEYISGLTSPSGVVTGTFIGKLK